MSKSRGITLLLVADRQIGRADFDAAGQPLETRVAGRPAGSDAATALASAVAMGGKCAPVVHIIHGEVFAHSLVLPPAQTAGMGDGQLAKALAYEVEPYSGIPAAGSSIGFVRTAPGKFSVLQVALPEHEKLVGRARAAGGREIRITAPPDGQVREIAPEAADVWFTAACESIANGSWPLVDTPEKPKRSLAPREVMLVSLAVAFALVLAGRAVANHFLERARALDAACSRDAAAVAAARKQTDLARQRSGELDAVAEARASIERGRLAVSESLAALAEKRTANLVVRSIDGPAPFQLRVRGIALTPGEVDQFSLALAGRLAGAGWTVVPDGTLALQRLADGGPWEFTLALRHALGSSPADPDRPDF